MKRLLNRLTRDALHAVAFILPGRLSVAAYDAAGRRKRRCPVRLV